MTVDEYKRRYQKHIEFIDKYKRASNASTGSEVDSNANVESKNITTLSGEIYKREAIGTNRLLMINKLIELYGEEWAERYIDRLESHLLYKHDETNLGPYTYSSKEVVVARVNGNVKLISLEDLYDLCDAEAKLVDAEKGVWCKYPADNTIQVLDRDGYTEVSRLVRKQRHRDLVRVKTAFGEDLIVTDNHPLIISDDVNDTIDAIDAVGRQQFRTELRIPFQGRTIEALNVLSPWNVQQYDNFYMSQIIPRGSYTAVNNNVQMDRDMGYLIGFFIGDGNYVAHAGEITSTVSFTQKDKQVLEKLAEIIHQHLGIGSVISHKKDKLNCWNLTIQSADLVLLLSQICGIKHYAPHKTLPVNIYDYTEDFALGVIDGLIDSDGAISRDGTCSIRLASRTAIMQLTMLAHSLGFAGGNIVQNTPFSNNTLYTTNYTIFGYQWKLTTKDMRRLHADKIAKIENATSGGTKYKAGWSNIVNVTTVDNGSFLQDNDFIYDITTGSHSFICNGLWVHNCVSITLYPFLFNGLVPLGGQSEAPKNLDSFCGSFVNLVFAVAAQFAGAVSTPEFLTYLDYFLRREFGEDYYKRSNDIVIHSIKPKTICDRIDAAFQQVVYSLNQPAAARNFQSVFWNIAYFDDPYFHGIFTDFVFPDGTTPCWESVSWLQKYFMKWFNKERTKQVLTFPVETMNLLDDGVNYVDQEWADFAAEMYAEGHSFFTYRSGSVDSLASCCFAPDTQVLVRSSDGERLIPIKELHDTKWADKRNLTVFHNGSWVSAKTIALPAVRPMYRIETANKKVVEATDNHIFPTLRGDMPVSELTTDDYILCNTRPLMAVKERDLHLTYEQGFLIGMYLGDGSIRQNETKNHAIYYSTDFSLNEAKYTNCIGAMRKALSDCDIDRDFTLGTPYNNVYPVRISGEEVVTFIREYVVGKYAAEKGLNPSIFAQSYDFRKGILDGLYATDGGNSNRIYTTSERLVQDLEALCTSLGLSTVIDVSDRTDEKCVIREQEYNHNYPLWCVRWYTPQNRRTLADVYKVINNGIYFKVQNITSVANNYDSVYCFECRNQDEPYFTLPNGMITHNCRLRNELQDNTFSYTLGAGGIATGSKGVMTININRLVQWAVRDGIDISDAVRQIVDECHHYLIAFNEIMKDNFKSKLLPVYDAGYISLEKQFLTIGINGFVEGAEFLGIDITPNEQYFEYGEKILRPIFEANKAARTDELMFNTEFVPKVSGHIAA